jgi:multisubunit Na+/H+ antiporter MnhC subunit
VSTELLSLYLSVIAMVAFAGVYYLLATRSLVRSLIALELVAKAVTILLVLAGKVTHNEGLAQALVITMIVVEVVVMVVATGLVLLAHKQTGTIDVRNLRNIKE